MQSDHSLPFAHWHDSFADVWFFEMIDMLNKLIMTSITTFFWPSWQMPLGDLSILATRILFVLFVLVCLCFLCLLCGAGPGMAWTTVFVCVLLIFSPYIRKGDDRLHLFAEVTESASSLAGLY